MIDILIGAGIAYGGVLLGRWREKTKKTRYKEPQPICGCGHHISFHDEDSGPCHARKGEWYWKGGDKIYPTCTCRKYTGPEPLPTYLP